MQHQKGGWRVDGDPKVGQLGLALGTSWEKITAGSPKNHLIEEGIYIFIGNTSRIVFFGHLESRGI